jgi:hypothetical protein
MVHVVPGSITISPSNPSTTDVVTFRFKAALDYADYGFVLGFHAIYYLLKKEHGAQTSIWEQVTTLDCNNCVAMTAVNPSDLSVTFSGFLPGTYDFMIIEQGDWQGTGKNDSSRYATISNITVGMGEVQGQTNVVLTIKPVGSTVIINGETRFTSSGSYTIGGNIGDVANVTVSKEGYVTKTIQVPYSESIKQQTISLDLCYPGGLGCAVECYPACTSKETCINGTCVKNAASDCEGLNRDGGFDPSCIMAKGNEMYLYGAIAIIAYFLLTSGEKK